MNILQSKLIDGTFKGQHKVSSNSQEEFIKQYRTALEQTKGIKGVVYVFKTDKPMPRVKNFSNILYVGATKYDVWNRYNVKQDTLNYWHVYNHIINNYGAISIDVYRSSDHKKLETLFLKQYFKAHKELPPINRKG